MPRYMLFITLNENYRTDSVPPALQDAMGEFIDENLKSGVLKDTGGLRPSSEGARVRLSRGKINVTDGPFTETKEVVGGYAIVELASKKEAVDVATKFMDLHRVHWPEFEGTCEVRPFDESVEQASAASAAAESASS